MGTSRSTPPSPKWSNVKSAVTTALNFGAVSPPIAHDLLSQFVQQMAVSANHEGFGAPISHVSPQKANVQLGALLSKYPEGSNSAHRSGGTREATGGNGGGGKRSGTSSRTRGGKGGRYKAISGTGLRSTAQRVASFLSDVKQVGLVEALRERGFSDVESIPPEHLAVAIADLLHENSSHIVEVDLREALSQVFEKICDKQQDITDVETSLDKAADDIGSVLTSLFESYIIERFKNIHGEHLAKEHDYEAADKIVRSAREFVAAELALEGTNRRDLTQVDWAGKEGELIVNAILERTVAVYIDPGGAK